MSLTRRGFLETLVGVGLALSPAGQLVRGLIVDADYAKRLQTAINNAARENARLIYVPSHMVPYTPTMHFSSSVHLVRSA